VRWKKRLRTLTRTLSLNLFRGGGGQLPVLDTLGPDEVSAIFLMAEPLPFTTNTSKQ